MLTWQENTEASDTSDKLLFFIFYLFIFFLNKKD